MKNKFFYIFLIIVTILLLFFFSNKDKFYIAKANYCLKKNEISCAQSNFEKAFALGVNSVVERDKYVISIINSPFTLKAQEKVLKFLEIDINDSASIKLEYFLQDLKMEIIRKYSGNFIKQAPYNQKILRWGKLPITYSISREENVPQYYEDEIDGAFVEWERATEHLLLFEKNEKSPNIIIELKSINPANKKYDKFVAAYTTPNVFNENLLNMEIVFYTTDPFGRKISKVQLYNTALHEIAHALGVMGHSRDSQHVMYMVKDSNFTNKGLRADLQEGDINTIKLLYKIKPDITNSEECEGEYLPEIVLGDDNDIVRVKMEEAKNYIKNVPTVVSGYIDLAESYVATKEYTRAIRALEHALQLADNDEVLEMIYFNLALTYFYLDNNELAKEYLERSIKYENSENKRFLLAEIYKNMGKMDLAEKEYKYLIFKDSTNSEYVIALTNLYILEKKFMKARSVLRDFFKRNPEEKNNIKFDSYGILKFGL